MKIDHHYKTLQVSPAASKDEIKKAYRKLALQYHPDKHGGDTLLSERFAVIKAAYEVLVDDAQRRAYDAMLFVEFAGKRKSVAANALAFYRKVDQLTREIKNSNSNHLDYDWLFLNILSLLRSAGIQDAVMQDEDVTFVRLMELINKLPYKELLELNEDVLTIFEDTSIHLKWKQFVSKKRLNAGIERYRFIVVLVIAVVVVSLIVVFAK